MLKGVDELGLPQGLSPLPPSAQMQGAALSSLRGFALTEFDRQTDLLTPPGLASLLRPMPLAGAKAIRREEALGMEKLKPVTGIKWEKVTFISLLSGEEIDASVEKTLAKSAFREGPAEKTTRLYSHADGRAVTFLHSGQSGRPRRVELSLRQPTQAQAKLPDELPKVLTAISTALSAFKFRGFERGAYHTTLPGSRDTDVDRYALAFVGDPAALNAARESLREKLIETGWESPKDKPHLLELKAESERLTLNSEGEPGQLVVTWQHRWKRPEKN